MQVLLWSMLKLHRENGVNQRLWGEAEWTEQGRFVLDGQASVFGRETRSLPWDSTDECSSPPLTPATVPLFCIYQGWKSCRKYAGYFPLAQALLQLYDVTSSLCFRILSKMRPRQPLPIKWNIFATLDRSDQGVRELLCFNPNRAKN